MNQNKKIYIALKESYVKYAIVTGIIGFFIWPLWIITVFCVYKILRMDILKIKSSNFIEDFNCERKNDEPK